MQEFLEMDQITFSVYKIDANKQGALSIRPKFPVGISEISMYQMERYFPPGSFLLARDKFEMADLRTFLFLSEFFDDFEFTDGNLKDNDDVVMFKKAVSFFRYNHV